MKESMDITPIAVSNRGNIHSKVNPSFLHRLCVAVYLLRALGKTAT